jgi:hypothetical protein
MKVSPGGDRINIRESDYSFVKTLYEVHPGQDEPLGCAGGSLRERNFC